MNLINEIVSALQEQCEQNDLDPLVIHSVRKCQHYEMFHDNENMIVKNYLQVYFDT